MDINLILNSYNCINKTINTMRMKLTTILMTTLLFFMPSSSFAQTLETTTDYTTGYVKMDRSSGQVLRVQNGAIYAGDWLIKVESTTEPQTFDIPGWGTRICPGAFSGSYISTLRFPSSWTEVILWQPTIFIAPQAFDNSNIQNFETYNDGNTTSVRHAPSSNTSSVVSRYNIQGMRLNETSSGINIEKHNDGTVSKILGSN